MEQQHRIRIINKSKDGVTLDFKEPLGIQKTSWDEFNKIYEICSDNKVYCVPKPEWIEKGKKAHDLISDALVYYLQCDWKIASQDPNVVPDLIHMGVVGKYVEEISQTLEISYLDAYKLLNLKAIEVRQSLGGEGSFQGLGAHKILKPKPHEYKETTSRPATNKLGDFNPGLQKLKEQLQSWEENK